MEQKPMTSGARERRRTKTQESLIRIIAGETALHGGLVCSKRELADRLGRNVKTVDRALARLRLEGVIEVEMRYDERGAQTASGYRANFSQKDGA